MAYPNEPNRPKSREKHDLGAIDGAQLSPPEGVKKGVGTIALNPEMYPPVTEKASKNGSPVQSRAIALTDMSDADIMLRAGAGDDSAFEYLVEKFRRAIVSFMYRMTHNQAIAEELAQEVFLRVYRSRSSYQAEAKFTTWLY